MNKKRIYEAPDAELLMVRFEENILSGPFNDYGAEKFDIEDEETI